MSWCCPTLANENSRLAAQSTRFDEDDEAGLHDESVRLSMDAVGYRGDLASSSRINRH